MASVYSPSLPLQAAIYAMLTTGPKVVAAFKALQANPADMPRVYDTVPTGPDGQIVGTFPYIVIGEDQIVPKTAQLTDEAFAKIEIWSRPVVAVDFGELKTLEGAARDTLSDYIPIEGFQTVTWSFHGSIPRKEPDGITRRQILTMAYILAPAPGA